jgi:hypothetical protein
MGGGIIEMSVRARPLLVLVIIVSAALFLAAGVSAVMCFMAAACQQWNAMFTFGSVAALLLVCLLSIVIWESMPKRETR